jgi:hypothetical protein
MVAGPITIAVLLLMVFWELGKVLLGLTPEQQAAAELKRLRRQQRKAERLRQSEIAAFQRQQQEWFERVKRQQARGRAGFADEAAARAALRGRGGRPSSLDDRWF